MRHGVDGRKLGRNTSHRRALFRNLANSVLEQEQVTTTVAKAKEIRRVVDRLITLGKKGSPEARRLAFDRTRENRVVKKLFGVLSERYKSRKGGYTRVLKLAEKRRGDGADLAIVELVDHPAIQRKRVKAAATDKKKKDDDKKAAAEPDPLKGMRKVFGQGKQKKKRAAAGEKKANAPATNRTASKGKTPKAQKKV